MPPPAADAGFAWLHGGGKDLGAVMAALDIGDEYLWNPDRLVPFEHWVGHIPFAFWLMKVTKPQRFVELGTHRGNSYCAMCQAVAALTLDAVGYAIDTWRGDIHMGEEPDLLAELRAYHDPRYGSFSTLIEASFDDARPYFADGSIDVLHIDGTHTYDAVRHDFETWLPTMSPRGIVLFHDTMVKRDDFGVWRLWEELSSQYPSFNFTHSFGLGVLAVGPELPDAVRSLVEFGAVPQRAARLRGLFATRGDALVNRLRWTQVAAGHERALAEAAERQAQLEAMLARTDSQASEQRAALDAALERAVAEASAQRAELEAALARANADAATERAKLEAALDRVVAETQAELEAARSSVCKNEAMSVDAVQRREAALRDIVKAERAARETAEYGAQAAQARLADLEEELAYLRARDSVIESSTTWQLTRPLRATLSHVPPGVRRKLREALQVAKWTLTFQLRERLAERRRLGGSHHGRAAPRAPAVAYQPSAPAARVVNALAEAQAKPAVPSMPDLFACRGLRPRGRIAVVMHLFFPEIWSEFAKALESIEEPFDLFVSIADSSTQVVSDIKAVYPAALVYQFPNHGRDILPFLAFAETGVLNHYDLVCKLHSKRSVQMEGGDAWRRRLVGDILGSPERVREILDAFAADPDLGIVVADNGIYGESADHWRDNKERVLQLGARIGITHVSAESRFPGGSIYWIRPLLIRTLVGLELRAADFEPEPITIDGTTAHAMERLIGLVCADAGMQLVEIKGLADRKPSVPAAVAKPTIKLIANYLPQFHPIPENDAWWGAGFTEWTNVTRAKPQFDGHKQPRLPGELGFYDLRLAETREAQASLARQHGIDGFCYYYYWFAGRGVLRRPLDDMLSSGRPDFPFMICWANEPWSRNWDGGSREVLLPQTYGEDWSRHFARDVAPILRDPRYVRLEGRPVLQIYRVMHIPDRRRAFDALRDELRGLGVGEIHLCGGWVGFTDDIDLPKDAHEIGLDAYFEFPPHRLAAAEITNTVTGLAPDFTGRVYSYDSAISSSLAEGASAAGRHRAVMLGWDNTARRMHRAHVFHGATPGKLRRWLRGLLQAERTRPGGPERLLFVNAWNEWAEGACLEPDRVFGRGWLEAVVSARAQPGQGLARTTAVADGEVVAGPAVAAS